MRKIPLSFLRYLAVTFLFILFSLLSNAQIPSVPVLGPVTFGTGKDFPLGWDVRDDNNDKNTWEMINSPYFASSGYTSPGASGFNHIKIDASASPNDYLYSPVIDCSNFTQGILKLGIWRYADYTKTLYIYFDIDGNNDFKEFMQEIPPDSMPKPETWRLLTINLYSLIDHRPKVRIRFCQSMFGETSRSIGPLRIDDITLYANTTTLPTDHFRTRTSGNWNDNLIWESSHDSILWIPSTLTPCQSASSITIQESDSVVNTSPQTADNLIIKKGGILTLAHDLTLNNGAGEDLSIEEGGIIYLSTYHITGSGTIKLNGHIKTACPEGLCGSNATSLTMGVNLNCPGNNSVIEYNANGTQSISPQVAYANLTISGSGDKALTGSTIVSRNLHILEGHLLLDNYNLAVGNSVIGTPASYIKINGTGQLTIYNIGPDSRTFPVGKSSYNPVTISNGSGLNWTVGIEDKCVSSDPGLAANSNKSVRRTWSITPSINPPPLAAEVLLEYNDSDPSQVGNEFNKEALVQVWRQAEDGWLGAGVTQKPGNSANGARTVSFSSDAFFSLFTISNLSAPLPILFRDVTARLKQGTVSISFTNAAESGVENYILERSDNGMIYKALQVIRPIHNDGSQASYELKDPKPMEGHNLYRITGKEKSGAIVYSPVVRVDTRSGEARMTIVPNPANGGEVSVQLTNVTQGIYKVTLYNAKGQVLHHQTLQHAGGSASFPLKVDHLQPGTYLIEFAGKEKLLQRFVLL